MDKLFFSFVCCPESNNVGQCRAASDTLTSHHHNHTAEMSRSHQQRFGQTLITLFPTVEHCVTFAANAGY
ncbi:hypothetical protein DAPPUDRAFT_234134 [Daphnia pulex]|uniref:Uncharacterized protein n=1 Tax=Daphnia pulex TaxID=6669 RepID=E9FUN3_DAPPU|nr:hypothetical protein DAPPUDRAFT_234134 [Daphnia pulex]|eukprot:EFX88896.1 hypothetical protein DAPPUDRAFT_234134 [Daphnia pulex]